ncbi:LrgB family protein, partial [uncultured Muribaculum sp.]
MSFLDNQYFLLALTFIIYVASQLLQRRTGISMLNPILLSTVAIIVFLLVCDIDYDTYSKGGEFIDFWLKPAVVALGVPLYRQLESIKKQFLPILLAEVAGCIVGIASVVIVAQILGASREVVMSLASKSVTTPIAIEVTQAIGGIPALTAAVVVCTGIFGGMTGFRMMKL